MAAELQPRIGLNCLLGYWQLRVVSADLMSSKSTETSRSFVSTRVLGTPTTSISLDLAAGTQDGPYVG